eukprot:gene4023-7279_t
MQSFFLLLFVIVTFADVNFLTKIDPLILIDFKTNNKINANILLKEKPNFTLFHNFKNSDEKAEQILKELKDIAKTSQKSLIQFLTQKNKKFTSFYISNMIHVKNVDFDLIKEISTRIDVKKVTSDSGWKIQISEKAPSKKMNENKPEIEWNIQFVNATKVWAQGIDGTGYTVANADSGIHFTHEALIKNYRGNIKNSKFQHDYHWYDGVQEVHFGGSKCGVRSKFPCDESNHGSHTLGTAVGASEKRKIGVAPGAKWIACRVLENGWTRPVQIMRCLQFFMAPHDSNGKNPNIKLRPISIGNSYHCPHHPSTCPDTEVFKDAIEALYEAGVLMVVSAGNRGTCGSINEPPTHYEKSFVVGATHYKSMEIAPFSSKGPVLIDGSKRRKPDIVAPGINIRSCVPPGNSYSLMSGTSMSSPIVTGSIALLYQAVPEIARNLSCVTRILEITAFPRLNSECGSPRTHPNNVFGYGIIDIEKAVKYAKIHKCK